MDEELSEELHALREAITEAMWNSESVERAIHAILRRSGNDVQLEINLVLLDVKPEEEPLGPEDSAGKLPFDPTDSHFLRALNISDL